MFHIRMLYLKKCFSFIYITQKLLSENIYKTFFFQYHGKHVLLLKFDTNTDCIKILIKKINI